MGAGASVADIGSASDKELVQAFQAATIEQQKHAVVDAPAETKARLAAAIGNAEAAGLRSMLTMLFNLYDTDGDGEIILGEFVEAHEIVTKAVDAEADTHELMQLFFELTLSGPLRFEDFLSWQTTLSADTNLASADLVRDVMFRIEAIEKARKQVNDPATHTAETPLSVPGIDSEIGMATRDLRVIRKKLRVAESEAEKNALSSEEAVLSARMRELWCRRRQEFQGKLVLRGVVQSEGQKLAGVDIRLGLAGDIIASASTDRHGKFELIAEAQLGRRMTLVARKNGFADACRPVGGEGNRHVQFELVPLCINEKFDAEYGKRDTVEVLHSGCRFEVPVGELVLDGKPFTGQAEFSVAIVDVASKGGAAAMPPLQGRSLAGSTLSITPIGCVFVSLKDSASGKDLNLQPGGSGIYVTMPSASILPSTSPSVWHYNEHVGKWEQTLQPLIVNGIEVHAPDTAKETNSSRNVVEEGLAEKHKTADDNMQLARNVFDEQRRQAGKETCCTCGFKAKKQIMPIVRDKYALSLADPPKRIFSCAASSGISFAFPYSSDEELLVCAEQASQHPEVVLSHHLAKADLAMNIQGENRAMQRKKYYSSTARHCLESLQHVAEYLLQETRVVDMQTQVPIDDIDWALINLKALQKLASFWIQGKAFPCVPPPSLAELKDTLESYSLPCTGPDPNAVSEAVLAAAARQALLEDVALVRERLKIDDSRHTVKFSVVERAIDEADGDVAKAVSLLLKRPEVKSRLEKLKLREELYNKLPMAHPTSRQLEKALAATGGDLDKASDMLKADVDVQKTAEKVYTSWRDTLVEGNSTNLLACQVLDPGWNSLGSYSENPRAQSEQQSACGGGMAILEFFPPERRRVCPIGDAAMVCGAFDEGVFAANATAVSFDQNGVRLNYTEDVQADGTFTLTAMACSRFDLETSKSDGTVSFSYGPFHSHFRRFEAGRANQITHLGLLGPHRDDSVSWSDLTADVNIMLPALEFPKCGDVQASVGDSDGPLTIEDDQRHNEDLLGKWSYTSQPSSEEDDAVGGTLREGGFIIRRPLPEEEWDGHYSHVLCFQDGRWKGSWPGGEEGGFWFYPKERGGGEIQIHVDFISDEESEDYYRKMVRVDFNMSFRQQCEAKNFSICAVRDQVERCTCFDRTGDVERPVQNLSL